MFRRKLSTAAVVLFSLIFFTQCERNSLKTDSLNPLSLLGIDKFLTFNPMVAIGPPSFAAVNSGGSVSYSIIYSNVTTVNLTATDITLTTTGTAACPAPTVTNGTTFAPTVTLSGCTGDGTAAITIAAGTSSDDEGNMDTGAGPGPAFTVDNTNPTVTLTSAPAINATNAAGYTVSGTCSESGRTVTVTVGGSVSNSPACSGGTFTTGSMNVSGFVDGPVSVTADHADMAGNSAVQASTPVTKDTVAPTVVLTTTPAINAANAAGSYNVSGTCTENLLMVIVSINGADNASGTCMGGTFSVTGMNVSAPPDGTVTVGARHSDAAGNQGTDSTSVSKDTVLPTVAIGAPSTSPINSTGSSSFAVIYAGADTVNLTNGDISQTGTATCGTVNVTDGTTATPTVTLSNCTGDGTVAITVAANTASDTAGNWNLAEGPSGSFTVDNMNPTVAFTSTPAINASNVSGYIVSGTCTENGLAVTVTVGGLVSDMPTCTLGAFTTALMNVGSVPDGASVSVAVSQTDAAANSGINSTTVVKDTVPPVANLAGQPVGTSSATLLNVTVSGTDVQFYQYKAGETASTDCSNASGYGAAIPVSTLITDDISGLADGSITLCVVGSDTAGNLQPYASATSATWTKDTTVPSITSAVTQDTDNDGRIDRYLVTFDSAVNDSSLVLANWIVAGYTITGWDTGTANDNQISLVLSEMTFPDTGVMPDVTTIAAGAIQDMAGNSLGLIGTATVTEQDGAPPRFDSVVGAVGSDMVTVTFTEPVHFTATTGCSGTLSSWGFTPGGGAVSSVSPHDDNACDDSTLTFRTNVDMVNGDIDSAQISINPFYDSAAINHSDSSDQHIRGLINSFKFGFDTTSAGANVTADVNNFPVLLRITNPAVIDATRANGDDIRFQDQRVADGGTGEMIPFQIERWDQTNDVAEVWVLVPTVSGNTNTDYITMYYGEKSASTVPGRQEPARVFGTGNQFAGVWHMAQPTVSTAYDSTANKNNSTVNTTERLSGVIGLCHYFNGTTYIQFDDTAVNNGDALDGTTAGGLMISTWVKPDFGSYGTNQILVAKQSSTLGDGYSLLTNTQNENITLQAQSASNMVSVNLAANSIETDWYYYVAYLTQTGSTGYLYFNGADSVAAVNMSPAVGANETAVTLGRLADGFYPFTGLMDEVRIESTWRGADWVKLCYENQRPDQTLVKEWYDAAWPYRIKITIPAAQVSAPVSDFPVYVNLAGVGSSFWTNVQGAGDIVITACDGLTKLPREIVSFTDAGSTGTGELWFRASQLSSTTNCVFYIYYGNASVPETNSADVWSNGYVGVWHLENSSFSDSSQTPTSNGTGIGYSSFLGGFGFGRYIDLDGTTGYITVPNAAKLQNLTGTATASLWIQPKSVSGTRYVLSKTYTGTGFDLAFGSTFYYPYVNATGPFTVNASLAVDTPYYHAVTFDGTAGRVYNNGVSILTPTIPSLGGNTGDLIIGRSSSGGGFYYGYIDEIHLSNVARSPGWIMTEYNNQSAPASFCNYGTQETP